MIKDLSKQVLENLFYLLKALVLLLFEIVKYITVNTIKPVLTFWSSEVKKEIKYIKNEVDNLKIFEK